MDEPHTQTLQEGFLSAADSDDLLRTIGDKLPKAFFFRVVHDADGRIQFTYLSQRVVEVLGLPAEALFAEPTVMLDVMVEDDRQRFLTAMERALTETMTLDVVVRVRRFDGELRWCHIRSATRNIEGTARSARASSSTSPTRSAWKTSWSRARRATRRSFPRCPTSCS